MEDFPTTKFLKIPVLNFIEGQKIYTIDLKLEYTEALHTLAGNDGQEW